MKFLYLSLVLLIGYIPVTGAADAAPWGSAKVEDIQYAPRKVVYDVALSDIKASIVIVLHGNEINYFAIKNYAKYKDLMQRAQSLTVGGIIKIEMCKIAAKGQGYDPQDIHGFVHIVPMADAEIVRLQTEEGYAYMR